MHQVRLAHAADFDGWRKQARALLHKAIAPEQVVWLAGTHATDLFGQEAPASTSVDAAQTTANKARNGSNMTVNKEFIRLSQYVVCHSDSDRFALLYRLLWRMNQGERNLLQNPCDTDVHRAESLRRSVSRDRHKMTAFVRFRKIHASASKNVQPSTVSANQEHYIAWFEPDHHIVRLTSDFFIKRFTNMNWSIYTPFESAHWNGEALMFDAGSERDQLPDAEGMEQLWRTYFASTFNPARLRIDAMQSEMPMKYWKNLPEAPIIASLIHNSGKRTNSMLSSGGTNEPKFTEKAVRSLKPKPSVTPTPQQGSLEKLNQQVACCDLCPHACVATQAVLGCFDSDHPSLNDKRSHLPIDQELTPKTNQQTLMIVGEQPGDVEDLSGVPFHGPAGALLTKTLNELPSHGRTLYFTNAVKHFTYSVKGKRRIHQRPSEATLQNCRPWLCEEIRLIQPVGIVALGRTAAKTLLGYDVKISQVRGVWTSTVDGIPVLVTTHPSAILRMKSSVERLVGERQLKQDLYKALEQKFEHGVFAPSAESDSTLGTPRTVSSR